MRSHLSPQLAVETNKSKSNTYVVGQVLSDGIVEIESVNGKHPIQRNAKSRAAEGWCTVNSMQ